jgi:hypothetical protein
MWNNRDDIAVSVGMNRDQSPTSLQLPITRRRMLGGALSLLTLSFVGGLGDADIGHAQNMPSLAVSDGYVVVDGWVLPGKYFRA